MSRPTHHPNCALSRDAAASADEDLLGYRAPKCTCRQHRKVQAVLSAKRIASRGQAFIPAGASALGFGLGNYWTPPRISE